MNFKLWTRFTQYCHSGLSRIPIGSWMLRQLADYQDDCVSKIRSKSYSGFTLVEILVVTALLVTVGMMTVRLFFSSLKGSSKTAVMTTVKQNGDYAITVMERMIRNAREVPPADCSSSQVRIKNPDGNYTTFSCGAEKIASTSAFTPSVTFDLTNDRVRVVDAGCSIFTCQLGERKVRINFTLEEKPPLGVTLKVEEKDRMQFNTIVNIRSLRD